MALALDATNTSIGSNNSTWSHTCTGSNLVLLVAIAVWLNGGTGAGASGVTYNGVAMTKIGTTQQNGQFATEFWILVNPATGSNTITPSGISSTTTKAASYSFTGADQTTGYDVVDGTTGTGTSITKALTLGDTNEYMVDILSHLSANNYSAHSDTSVLDSTSSGVLGASQYSLKTGSGSQSMSYTMPDNGDAWTYSVVAIKAASAVVNPKTINNYQFVKVGDGMSTSEKIK